MGESDAMQTDPNHASLNHQHFSYFSRGIYIDQLERLFSLFPRENVMVLMSEELFADPASTYARALQFLGCPADSLSTYERLNSGRYADMDPSLRRRLTEYFAEANDRLSRFLGVELPWK